MPLMDGSAVMPAVRQGDIEHILIWAFGQTSYVRHESHTDRGALFNHGYDAVPRGGHGLFAGGTTSVTLRRNGMADAAAVVEAVEKLDPYSRSIVTRCAKSGARPDCMLGIDPVRVPVTKRSRKGHRRRVVGSRWEPCDPKAICVAREIYSRWHAAVARLCEAMESKLSGWHITGFRAPKEPWTQDA
jgi:hypothetical protein